MEALLIVLGLVGLVFASDVAVNGAKGIAAKLGISPLMVGLTITSIGTSLPEIATNISVALNSAGGHDASAIAVGNVIGSNLSQITLLLGITALVAPLAVRRKIIIRDGLAMFVAMGAMFLTCVDGVTTRGEAITLMAIYAGYLTVIWRTERAPAGTPRPEPVEGERSVWIDVAATLAGLAVVVFAADLVIDNSVVIARAAGVSETVIGLFVGIATGLPELSVGVRSVRAGAPELALGNLIGSNVTDPLLSYGAGAAVHDVVIPNGVIDFDFPFWGAATALALIFMASRGVLGRREGAALILVFAGYMTSRALVVGI